MLGTAWNWHGSMANMLDLERLKSYEKCTLGRVAPYRQDPVWVIISNGPIAI